MGKIRKHVSPLLNNESVRVRTFRYNSLSLVPLFLLCPYWWPSRSGSVTHGTGFLEFRN